jgi:hypothetical protein
MKAELRNELIRAACESLDGRLRLELPELDAEQARLWKQADALMALSDLLEEDPAAIVVHVTKALEAVNAAIAERMKEEE